MKTVINLGTKPGLSESQWDSIFRMQDRDILVDDSWDFKVFRFLVNRPKAVPGWLMQFAQEQ